MKKWSQVFKHQRLIEENHQLALENQNQNQILSVLASELSKNSPTIPNSQSISKSNPPFPFKHHHPPLAPSHQSRPKQKAPLGFSEGPAELGFKPQLSSAHNVKKQREIPETNKPSTSEPMKTNAFQKPNEELLMSFGDINSFKRIGAGEPIPLNEEFREQENFDPFRQSLFNKNNSSSRIYSADNNSGGHSGSTSDNSISIQNSRNNKSNRLPSLNAKKTPENSITPVKMGFSSSKKPLMALQTGSKKPELKQTFGKEKGESKIKAAKSDFSAKAQRTAMFGVAEMESSMAFENDKLPLLGGHFENYRQTERPIPKTADVRSSYQPDFNITFKNLNTRDPEGEYIENMQKKMALFPKSGNASSEKNTSVFKEGSIKRQAFFGEEMSTGSMNSRTLSRNSGKSESQTALLMPLGQGTKNSIQSSPGRADLLGNKKENTVSFSCSPPGVNLSQFPKGVFTFVSKKPAKV